MDQLKPCRECSGKASITTRDISGDTFYRIKCTKCGAKQFGYFINKKRAIEAWNEEKNPSPLWREKQMSVTAILDEVKEDICKNYCKYAKECEERMEAGEELRECPLDRL